MPTYEKHMAQAKHNEDLLSFFTSQSVQNKFSDWYVTAAFYSALHYFEAVLDTTRPSVKSLAGTIVVIGHSGDLRDPTDKKKGPSEHSIRRLLIKSTYPQIYRYFRDLYKASQTSRYDCHAYNNHKWEKADFQLAKFKNTCLKLIDQKKK